MPGEPAVSEPEAALGSPEVGRMLHTIDTDLVQLKQLGPAISDEWRIAVVGERLLAASRPGTLRYCELLELGLNVADLCTKELGIICLIEDVLGPSCLPTS